MHAAKDSGDGRYLRNGLNSILIVHKQADEVVRATECLRRLASAHALYVLVRS